MLSEVSGMTNGGDGGHQFRSVDVGEAKPNSYGRDEKMSMSSKVYSRAEMLVNRLKYIFNFAISGNK